MSFIRLTEGFLQIGGGAGDTFRKVIGLLHDAVVSRGMSLPKALEVLLAEVAEHEERELLTALKDWVSEHGDPALANLLEPLNIIERRVGETKRQLGWPSNQWAWRPPAGGRLAPFGLNLDAAGGAVFEVAADVADGEESRSQARAVIRLRGELDAGASGDVSIPYGGVTGKLETNVSRTLSYVFDFQLHSTLTGVALGSSLSLVASPADGRAVAKRFASDRIARLEEIAIDGAQKFGGELGIRANFPTHYGTPGIFLGGKLRFSSGFRYTIRSVSEQRLEVHASANRSRSHEGEIGLSYTVGLSTVAPEAAQALLQRVTDLHELLVGIDERTEEFAATVKTWLKPGHLIQERLSTHVADLFASADERLPRSAAAGLGRLFGIDTTEDDVTSEAVIQHLSDQTASMIANLLDELPETLNVDDAQLRQRLKDAFVGAVNAEVITALDTNVFAFAKKTIDDALQSMAGRVDGVFKQQLDEFLGPDAVVDTIDAVRQFIKRARELSQQVLQKVSAAQTELLTAEIGWQRAKQRGRVVDYAAAFDVASDAGMGYYRKAILTPSAFGDLLFADMPAPGVEVLQAERVRTIAVRSGPRWSIALVGLALKGSRTSSRSIRIIESADGVVIETNNALERQRDFLRESRRVSFVTALNILEARPRDAAGGEPNSAASIKLHFAEEDSGMSLREAEYLLERFAEQPQLLSGSTLEVITREIRGAADAAGQRHIPATLSVGLAIAPSSVVAMLEYVRDQARQPAGLAASTESPILGAIVSALAQVDDDGIAELLQQSSDEPAVAGASPGADVVAAELQLVQRLETTTGREEFLKDLVSESKGLGNLGVNQTMLRRRRQRNQRERHKQDDYVDAIDALVDVLRLAAEIYFGDHTIDELDITAVTEQVSGWQEEMNDLGKEFLEAGVPPPGWARLLWKGRAPKKTVALFVALQKVAQQATGVQPPLKVTFHPTKGDAKSYFSLPA